MSRRSPRKPSKAPKQRAAVPDADLAELRRELAEARARLRRIEQDGADAYLARRIAELEEGQKVARGLAVEAALARSRAEAELRALRDAIGKAPGIHGWLLRRAQKRLLGS